MPWPHGLGRAVASWHDGLRHVRGNLKAFLASGEAGKTGGSASV
jgi:hypothetical protein